MSCLALRLYIVWLGSHATLHCMLCDWGPALLAAVPAIC